MTAHRNQIRSHLHETPIELGNHGSRKAEEEGPFVCAESHSQVRWKNQDWKEEGQLSRECDHCSKLVGGSRPLPYNTAFADNFRRDRKLTLTQNYRLLGLSSKLNTPTGGNERKVKQDASGEKEPVIPDAFAVPKNRKTTKLVPTETKVERDPETGRILRIIRADDAEDEAMKQKRLNPLNDPLVDLSEEETAITPKQRQSDVVADLEAQAEEEAEALARKKRPRQQSTREEEWIERLIEKHGDDTRAMTRDRKLNALQQSEGDIGRRVKKWKARHERVG